MKSSISKLCTPAMLYFFLSVIALAMSAFSKFNLMSLVIKGFFILLWTWFLNFLCKKGYKLISWFILALPFIMFLSMRM